MKVLYISSLAFSGSSVLNLLLDTQPTMRGVGEGAQVFSKRSSGGPCAQCKSTVADCALYGQWSGEPFYRFNFQHYACRVLVDASKSPAHLSDKPLEDDYAHHVLMLSKLPHEAAYSMLKHAQYDHWSDDRNRTPRKCFETYIAIYTNYLRRFRQMHLPIRNVHYRELVTARRKVIGDICHWIDEPFDDERLTGAWWETDTHVLGGNPAVIAQVSGDDALAFTVDPAVYLDGKYKDKRGQLFVDRSWRGDKAFIAHCEKQYKSHEVELDNVLAQLGYPPIESMLEDLHA